MAPKRRVSPRKGATPPKAAAGPSTSEEGPSAKQPRATVGSDGLRRIPVVGGSEVVVGRGLFARVPDEIAAALEADGFKASKYVILSDETVWGLYGEQLVAAFAKRGITPLHYAIAPGEKSKDRRVKEAVEDFMLANRCVRDTCVVALGGGVVGDLSGFVSATYLRGVPVFQVPTSMMAIVDSSVGGKTAVNVPAGKNLIGAFHQPRRVFADVDLLRSLGRREVAEGLAEVVKMGVIRCAPLFEAVEAAAKELLELEPDAVAHATGEAIRLKAEVVALDEKETGLRSTLNFGHTVGHAIEALMSPALLHGECVSIGMVIEAALARDLGELTTAAVGRITRCLKALGLPTALPPGLEVSALLDKMKLDKKNAAGAVRCTIVTGIGSSHDTPQPVAIAHLERLLASALTVVPPAYGSLDFRVRVPGSKSISNRVLLMAALGKGPCRLRGLLHSDDTHVMLTALQLISDAKFAWEEGGEVLRVDGCGGRLRPSTDKPLYLGNAGTASRFLTSTCALIEAKGAPGTTLTGDPRMKERPIGDLTSALRAIGCDIEHLESSNSLPIVVRARGLPGGQVSLSGKVSSQFVSSVLLSAPYARAPVVLSLPEAPVSQQYIEMTVQLMAEFGVQVEREGSTTYRVPKGTYVNPPLVEVEADASSATYPLAIAAISGGTVVAEAIGSKSTQGDAAFYSLCETMGCKVEQTERETRVTGPPAGVRLKPFDLDMESMTDAFMTAAALAAVADGTSTISGVANQRVKECNRIEATVTELRKLGVKCEETADGVRVTGMHPSAFRPARIHCYKDHRIAMSFATLGCAVPGVTLLDAACVDKTYPEFWSDLATKMGVGVEAAAPATAAASAAVASAASAASLVLVGMRASGKTSLGTAAARALGRVFVDLDERFVARHGAVSAYVEQHGWAGFRAAECALLGGVLEEHATAAVISTGGGVVESEASRALLAGSGAIVVHIDKSAADIVRTLDGEGSTAQRPAYGESTLDVLKRRAPLYAAVSSHDFVIREGDEEWAAVTDDFVRFVRRVTGDVPPPVPREHSFFLTLSAPTVAELVPKLPQLTLGVDALELRADLLADTSARAHGEAIATLRRHTRCNLVFTLRSKGEGGKFDGSEEAYKGACAVASRAAVELLDVEVGRTKHLVNAVVAACGAVTAVIGSTHDFHRTPTGGELDPEKLLTACALDGKAAIAKLVLRAESAADSLAMRALADRMLGKLRQKRSDAAVICICVGDAGKLSRVLNLTMTPVTHPLLVAGAPGQLSVAELVRLRAAQGFAQRARRFAIFGSPVGRSPSPAMHNAAFAAHSLPHEYEAVDAQSVDAVRAIVHGAADGAPTGADGAAATGAGEAGSAPPFGGASVTIPLKEQLDALLDAQTAAAAKIGAVNTLIRTDDGRTLGDNTDWIGIARSLQPHARGARAAGAAADGGADAGLVLGGGGTARAALFALAQLGASPLYVWNRTTSKAKALAEEFSAELVEDLATFSPPRLTLVVGTVPGSAGVRVPAPLLQQHRPAVMDAAYLPRLTPLLEGAAAAGCALVYGSEMLFEQGVAQFELWTGRAAPRKAMAGALAECIQNAEPGAPLPARLELELRP